MGRGRKDLKGQSRRLVHRTLRDTGTDVAVPRSKRYCRDCTKRLVSHLLYGTTSKSWHRVFSRRQWHNLISFAVGSINGGFYNSIKPRCIPHFVNTLLFKKLVDSSRCAADVPLLMYVRIDYSRAESSRVVDLSRWYSVVFRKSLFMTVASME